MLSAAHVLAMDAKNLLDVVDSIRIKNPDLFHEEKIENENYSIEEQAYENLKNETHPTLNQDEIYVNQPTLYVHLAPLLRTMSRAPLFFGITKLISFLFLYAQKNWYLICWKAFQSENIEKFRFFSRRPSTFSERNNFYYV